MGGGGQGSGYLGGGQGGKQSEALPQTVPHNYISHTEN